MIPSPGSRFPEAHLDSARLRYHSGIPILEVAGTPQQMGHAIGSLALAHAPRMASYPHDLLRKFAASWLAPVFHQFGESMVRRFEPDYRQEFESIVHSAGVDRNLMVTGNTLFDIKKFFACSALLVDPSRSRTAGTLFGRNLDYPSEGYAHQYSLVTIYRPTGKKAFVSVGFPGLIGVLSGMNEAGLCLAILEVFQAPLFVRRLDLRGTPYALCFRKILEECSTLAEAYQLLSRLRRTTMYNLAIADRHQAAVFEVTPSRVHVRLSTQGVCRCTNHFHHQNLQPTFPLNVMHTFHRDRTLRRVSCQFSLLGIDEIHQALHLTHQGDHTLQTMIFEPQHLRLHLAVGNLPSSQGPLLPLDLRPLLSS